MTPDVAKRYVIGGLVLSGVVAAAADLEGGEAPHLRILIGAVIAGTVLAVVAEGAPQVAASFALLILLSTVLAGGKPVATKVARLTTSHDDPKPGEHLAG